MPGRWVRRAFGEYGLVFGAVEPRVEQFGAAEKDLDSPIELPGSLNRFARAYVSRSMTSRSKISGHPLAESLRIGRWTEDRDRGGANSHLSCLPPLLSSLDVVTDARPGTKQPGS